MMWAMGHVVIITNQFRCRMRVVVWIILIDNCLTEVFHHLSRVITMIDEVDASGRTTQF